PIRAPHRASHQLLVIGGRIAELLHLAEAPLEVGDVRGGRAVGEGDPDEGALPQELDAQGRLAGDRIFASLLRELVRRESEPRGGVLILHQTLVEGGHESSDDGDELDRRAERELEMRVHPRTGWVAVGRAGAGAPSTEGRLTVDRRIRPDL